MDTLSLAEQSDPLNALLSDPTVVQVMVDGPERVYVERANGRLEDTDIHFTNDDHLLGLMRALIAPYGYHLSDLSPIVTVRLNDGSTLCAIIPPVAAGPVLTIRKSRAEPPGVDALIAQGAWDADMVGLLRAGVAARLNMLVAGEIPDDTTTILRAIATMIPDEERILLVGNHFTLPQQRVVMLSPRPADAQGYGEITRRDLVVAALHMRPDRVVVGEASGHEILPILQSMRSQVRGSLAGVYGHSPKDTLTRLEALLVSAEPTISLIRVRQMLTAALDLIVQVGRVTSNRYAVTHIAEVLDAGRDGIKLSDVFFFVKDLTQQPEGDDSRPAGRFVSTPQRSQVVTRLARQGVVLPPTLAPPD